MEGEEVILQEALAAASVVNAAGSAAGGVVVAAFDFSQLPVDTHLVEQVEQVLAQSRGIVDLDRGVVVAYQTVGRGLGVGFLDQKTVGGQLHYVRLVGPTARRGGDVFDLHRHQTILGVYQVVRLAGQPIVLREVRLRNLRPATRIGVDQSALGQSAAPLVATGAQRKPNCGTQEYCAED